MSRLSDLTPPLHSATMDGKVPWKLEGTDMIWTTQGPGVIEINERGPQPYPNYIFLVRNKDGIKLDNQTFSADEFFNLLSEIFRKVRRSALQVDQVIDGIKTKILSL